ncbi:MAG: hypothetical protein M3H12_03025, partial [Chromatiales bacterium]
HHHAHHLYLRFMPYFNPITHVEQRGTITILLQTETSTLARRRILNYVAAGLAFYGLNPVVLLSPSRGGQYWVFCVPFVFKDSRTAPIMCAVRESCHPASA